jgi:UDP-N-acetylglucosamine--N-acetylmuramyl-(pentapeptide) pyrophosphoryl-undecaprenol N-acetylglucosamine transferase
MKIIFCGGGTMGPVTPLLATIEKLKALRPEAVPVWVGTRQGVERGPVERLRIEYHAIIAAKLRRYFDLRTLLLPFVAAVAIVQSSLLILKLRPKAVVVSGSFIQVPLVMTARCLGVPVVLLQLDVEPGLANRISAHDAKIIVTALDTGVSSFGRRSAKVIGSPVRKIISDLIDPGFRAMARQQGFGRWALDESRPTILVLGGGTGALGMNERIVRNLDALLGQANILVVAGKGKLPEVQPRENLVMVEFLNEEMAEAFAVADLVVSRAGFGTLSELGVLGLPAVLIPLAGQQEKNATFLAEKKAALVVDSKETDRVFVDTVLRLLNDRDRRLSLSRAIAEVFPSDAAEKLARIILENVKK